MLRYCANCGTEVDESAVFCPTCGQPIDQEVEAEIRPAPSWPDPESVEPRDDVRVAPPRPDNFHDDAPDDWDPPSAAAAGTADRTGIQRRAADDDVDADAGRTAASGVAGRLDDAPPHEVDRSGDFPPAAAATLGETAAGREPTSRRGTLSHRFRERAAERPTAPPGRDERPSRAAPPGDGRADPPARQRSARSDLPVTMPVTLSAWLIGAGALLGAIGALLALFDGLGSAVDVLLLVGLLAVAASVFIASSLPAIPQLRLATLVVVLVAFGVALDRLGFGRAGAGELLLFLGTAAAAMGVILVETGNDQPLGGPSA